MTGNYGFIRATLAKPGRSAVVGNLTVSDGLLIAYGSSDEYYKFGLTRGFQRVESLSAPRHYQYGANLPLTGLPSTILAAMKS